MPPGDSVRQGTQFVNSIFWGKTCSALAKKGHTRLWYMIVFSIQNLSGLTETMRNFHLNGPRCRHLFEAIKGYQSGIAA
jgi:hypothetical protein